MSVNGEKVSLTFIYMIAELTRVGTQVNSAFGQMNVTKVPHHLKGEQECEL